MRTLLKSQVPTLTIWRRGLLSIRKRRVVVSITSAIIFTALAASSTTIVITATERKATQERQR